MEKKVKNPLFGRNPFAEAFTEFDEQAFFEDLHNTVKNKPYFQKYKGFKTTLLYLSYLFNAASALTASYAVFWLIKWLTGFAVAGYIVAAVFLFFLEKIKRKSSGEFWQVYFFRKSVAVGWLGLSLFCVGLSVVSSGFGVKQGTESLAPTPELLKADSMANYYTVEIERLEKKSADLRANKDKSGTTFYKLSDGITANEKTIAEYRARAKELEKKTEGKNDKLTTEYMAEVNLTAWTLVWLTLLMELLFECCIAYIWYYLHRSYVERFSTQKAPSTPTEHPYNVNNNLAPTLVDLQTKIEQLQAANEALKTQNIPPPSINGTKIENRKPIGFNTAPLSSVQTCTDLYTAEIDRYTVAHTYTKGGQAVTVRYTLPQVRARVGQYERDLQQAQRDGLGADVIENRKQWLGYWEKKRVELSQKTENTKV